MKHTNRLWAVKALARAGFECLGERVPRRRRLAAIGLSALGVLSACSTLGGASQPQLAPASGATLASCTDLAGKLSFPGTTFSAVEPVAAGALAGTSAHCRLTGQMNRRVSPVDGKTYAIGFEMRLPLAWNGRFFHQVNGGIDGVVAPAVGGIGGGGPLTDALQRGFAVISSDAGHDRAQNPTFGIDPQARLDYGYNAVGALTPMAKSVIAAAYGKGPDRSYIAGCSNGGRHAMVAAARYADQYDGILAGDPGFNLPQAAVAQLYGAQQYASIARATTTAVPGVPAALPDIESAFTPAELELLADRVVARCDALDGLADGIVDDVKACQSAFDLNRDVPTCVAETRDGRCLSAAQKSVLARIFAGARNSAGQPLYATFPYDSGVGGSNWRDWKFRSPTTRDPGAVGFIFQTPPEKSLRSGLEFALGFSMDRDAPKIYATDSTYTQASMTFMTPPHPTDLSVLRDRGAKIIVYHGTSDPVFSSDDTAAWYRALTAANGGDATSFARYFPVPGMNHCRGGPATDQFDMLTPLVEWVEHARAPNAVTASARGPGNAGGVNPEIPASWSPTRTRPLCPYPKVARYNGSGDIESAASFSCR
jgi:feruloyl esterase